MAALEEGLLIQAALPVRIGGDEAARKRILRAIGLKNYCKVRGGLVYHPHEERLTHRIFLMAGEQDKDWLHLEIQRNVALSVHELSEGYASVIAALDAPAQQSRPPAAEAFDPWLAPDDDDISPEECLTHEQLASPLESVCGGTSRNDTLLILSQVVQPKLIDYF